MKTKVLKLMALSAMMLVPIGAAATVSNTTWTFTSWSNATITNLEAGVWVVSTHETGEWDKTSNTYSWRATEAATTPYPTLTANGTAISELDGLTFYWPKGKGGRIKIYNETSNKALFLNSANERVYLTLVAGKKVTITSKANGSHNSRAEVFSNTNVVAYNQTDADQPERTDVFIVSSNVSSETLVGFKGSEDHGIFLYSIQIEDATEAELLYADRKAKFGESAYITSTSVWNFNQYPDSADVATGTLVNYSGLYLRGDNSKPSTTTTINTPQAVEPMGITIANDLSVQAGRPTPGDHYSNASSINTYQCGLNAGVPGTIYVVAMFTKTYDNRYFSMAFDDESIDNTSGSTAFDKTGCSVLNLDGSAAETVSADTYYIYKYTSNRVGAFVFGGSAAYRIAAVMFVPATDKDEAMNKSVSISDAGKATFCAAQNYTIPSGLTAYYVSDIDTENNTAKMTQITTGVIPACTGVILYGAEGPYEMVSSESATAIDGTNYLQANLTNYELPQSYVVSETNYYHYTLAADGFKHVASETPGTLAAGKAFLRTTLNVTGAGARLGIVFDDGETTGIEDAVKSEELRVKSYYDLQGRRVAQPTKGLYIVNGKKVIIK